MKHIDLFSGIGGAALAVEAVWPDAEHIFVEKDPYCQALLKLRFPNSQIHGDIRTFTADTSKQRCKEAEYRPTQIIDQNSHGIDILTGGWPCQPFSQAGRRKGTADDRYLWPEMLRVIREFKPTWIVGENVAGLLTIEQGMVFKQIIADLEGEGYEVGSFIIPAVAVGAPHRRDRVWIIANRNNTGIGTSKSRIDRKQPEKIKDRDKPFTRSSEQDNTAENSINRGNGGGGDGNSGRGGCTLQTPRPNSDDSNSPSERLQGERDEIHESGSQSHDELADGCNRERTCADAQCPRPQERQEENRTQIQSSFGNHREWDEDWIEVATRLCGVDDGLPAELDGLKLSKSKHRAERLKGLGNAWVPQVAIEIMKGIKQTT